MPTGTPHDQHGRATEPPSRKAGAARDRAQETAPGGELPADPEARPPRHANDPGGSAPQGAQTRAVIKVVDAKAQPGDFLELPAEELEAALRALAATGKLRATKQVVLEFAEIAAVLRARRLKGARPGGARGPGDPPPDEMEEIALRQVLYSRGVTPVIERPGGKSQARAAARRRAKPPPSGPASGEAPSDSGVYGRPGERTEAWLAEPPRPGEPRVRVGVAAEEGVRVRALELDPGRAGQLMLEAYSGGFGPGRRAALESGTFTPALLSAAATAEGGLPPLAPPGHSGKTLSLTDPPGGLAAVTLNKLRAQLEAAEDYHLTGVGGVLEAERASAGRPARGASTLPAFTPPHEEEAGEAPGGAHAAARDRQKFLLRTLAEIRREPRDGEAVFELGALGELYSLGAMGPGGTYYSVLVGGRESPVAAQSLAAAAAAEAASDERTALQRRAFDEVTQARQFAMIVEDKFGAGRASELALALARGGLSGDSPTAILGQLRPRERELVETEFENRKKEWEGQVNNTCPHVRLAFRMRGARTSREAERIRRELAGYYAREPGRRPEAPRDRAKASPAGEWILCRSCGFRTVCPHVDELVRMESEGLPYDRVRERLQKYAVRYSSAGAGGGAPGDRYTYYCRICSERLAEFVSEDRTADYLRANSRIDDGLRRLVWTEALAASEFVRFAAPVNPRAFAGAAADVCHPLLVRVEGQLPRARGAAAARRAAPPPARREGPIDPFADSEADEPIDPRTRLYAVIFVYAYVLSLIARGLSAGAGSRTAAGRAKAGAGFEGVKPGARLSAYASRVLGTIAKQHGGLIARVPDVTPEFIAARFREAFRLVSESGDEGPSPAPGPQSHVVEVMTIDPVYRYAVVAAKAYGALPWGPAATPAAARREFETALGPGAMGRLQASAPLNELGRALLGLRPGGAGGRRATVEYSAALLRGRTPALVHKDPSVNLYARIYAPKDAETRGVKRGPFERLAELGRDLPGAASPRALESYVGGASWGGRERAAAKRARRAPSKRPAKAAPPPRPAKAAPPSAKKGDRRVGASLERPLVLAEPRGGPPELTAADPAYLLEAYLLFVRYTAKVVDRAAQETYRTDQARFAASEAGYLLARAAGARKPQMHLNVSVSAARFPEERATGMRLTELFDENGLHHVWGEPGDVLKGRLNDPEVPSHFRGPPPVYVYRPDGGASAGETLELTRKEVASRLSAAALAGESASPLAGYTLVDQRCPVCGVLRSETDTLDAEKARRALDSMVLFTSFFEFYELRCPVEGVHEFSGGGGAGADACRKCGLPKRVGGDPRSPAHYEEARAYFDEFSDAFRRDRAAIRASTATEAARPAPAGDEKEAPEAERFALWAAAWKADYGVLIRAAELAKTTVPALEALGATEGREYADVLSGVGAPPPPETSDDPRLYSADASVRVFVFDYNRLRYAAHLSKIPPATARLLQESGTPSGELGGLAEKLPDVTGAPGPGGFPGVAPGGDYAARRRAIVAHQGAAAAYQFSTETLARMALAVADAPDDPPWLKKLGESFAGRTLRSILRGWELLSAHRRFDFRAAFGSEVVDAGPSGEGVDFDSGTAGDVGEDVYAELEAADAESEDGVASAYSLEAVDIDTLENLE